MNPQRPTLRDTWNAQPTGVKAAATFIAAATAINIASLAAWALTGIIHGTWPFVGLAIPILVLGANSFWASATYWRTYATQLEQHSVPTLLDRLSREPFDLVIIGPDGNPKTLTLHPTAHGEEPHGDTA